MSGGEAGDITLSFRSPATRAGALTFTGRLLAERSTHVRDETGCAVYETCSVYQTCGIYVLEYLRHIHGTLESDRHCVWLAPDFADLAEATDREFPRNVPPVVVDALAEAGKVLEGSE